MSKSRTKSKEKEVVEVEDVSQQQPQQEEQAVTENTSGPQAIAKLEVGNSLKHSITETGCWWNNRKRYKKDA